MLEVKHLFKEYKTKKGVTTKALDDVSLVFPEKGMVFILGKSGSGKSTLLNVCGGLDKADSGEIIIKGKSSKDFSSQDFDSYRNTYVGFVFQEYNILDEFSVEENIALALELQNKKRDRATIDKILDDVDLSQFASRKPNTLSGGQKQRVAIARALVKEPEIIMADEPTGALDSKTGQQVFDTLKKLSQDKLVIVISHDRDFAEQYADRIIELKDGKILSDMTRSDDPELNKNLQFFGTDTVCIKNGAQVTDAELKKIAAFLSKAGGTAVISTSREKINDFKQDRPEMDIGEFQNIKEQPKPKEYAPEKLIRSHLPVRHAIKVGAGSLKTKPVRLVFTILLSIIAFVLFGLMSTVMLFNEHNVTKETFRQSNYSYISLAMQYKINSKTYNNGVLDYEYEHYSDTKFTEADLDKISKEYGNVLAVYSAGGNYGGSIYLENVSLSSNAKQFYSDEPDGFILATDKLEKAYGEYPKEADEVMISSYLYNALKLSTSSFLDASGNKINIQSESDVISTPTKPVKLKIRVGGQSAEFKIVGIYRSSDVPDDYAELKQAADSGTAFAGDYRVSFNWGNERDSGLYTYLGVSKKFIDANKEAFAGSDSEDYNVNYFNYSQASVSYGMNGDGQDHNAFISGDTNQLAPYKQTQGLALYDVYGLDGNKLTSLSTAQFAISHTDLVRAIYDKISEFYHNGEYNELITNAQAAAEEAYRAANKEPASREATSYWNSMLQNARWAAEEEYVKAHPQPDYNTAEYDAWTAERQAVMDDAEQTFRNENPEPAEPTEAQKAQRQAWEEWKNGLQSAVSEAKDKYDKENPYPVQSEFSEKYGENWYEIWLEAYEEWDNNYNNVIPAAAEKDYKQKNPEPQWDHKQWEYGLKAAVEAAEAEADPFDGKFDELRTKIDSITYYNDVKPSDETVKQVIKEAYDAFVACGFTIPRITLHGELNNSDKEATIAGYFISFRYSGMYLSDDLYEEFYQSDKNSWYQVNETKYVKPKDAIISKIFVPYDRSDALTEKLLKLTADLNADDSKISITNPLMDSLEMAFEMMDILGKVFLYAGIVLAVFSFLLMFNFISASITAKKKEIGILRAIGARSLDVFKIFFSEALIIALICIVIAMVGTVGACILINNVIIDAMSIALFVFTPLTAVFIIAIAVVTAFLSTIIPVSIYSKKPPVESIRAL